MGQTDHMLTAFVHGHPIAESEWAWRKQGNDKIVESDAPSSDWCKTK